MDKQAFFKYDSEGRHATANDVYDAYYDSTHYAMYFQSDYWFQRELTGMELIKNKSYAPLISKIDKSQKLIILEYEDNLNHMIQHNRLPKNYTQQVLDIKTDLESMGLYKLNFYPHTFFYKAGEIFLIDNYGMASSDEKIYRKDIEKTVHDRDRFPFVDNYLDIVQSYNTSIEKNVGNWPDNFINE